MPNEKQIRIARYTREGLWPIRTDAAYIEKVATTGDSTICRAVLLRIAAVRSSPLFERAIFRQLPNQTSTPRVVAKGVRRG